MFGTGSQTFLPYARFDNSKLQRLPKPPNQPLFQQRKSEILITLCIRDTNQFNLFGRTFFQGNSKMFRYFSGRLYLPILKPKDILLVCYWSAEFTLSERTRILKILSLSDIFYLFLTSFSFQLFFTLRHPAIYNPFFRGSHPPIPTI